MHAIAEHRRSAASVPRSHPSHDEERAERRSPPRAAAYSAAPYAPQGAPLKERFGPTYGCVEWFDYEETVSTSQSS